MAGERQRVASSHSGSGGLRGGGIRPRLAIRDETLAKFFVKLEGRLGPVLLFCLVTVGTVLLINALYHESANGTLVELIEGVQREILLLQQNELTQLAEQESSSSSSTSTIITTLAETTIETTTTTIQEKMLENPTTSISFEPPKNTAQPTTEKEEEKATTTTTPEPQVTNSESTIETPPFSTTTKTTSKKIIEKRSAAATETQQQQKQQQQSPTTEAGGIEGTFRSLVIRRAEQTAELDAFKQRFRETDHSILMLILLSILGILFTIAGMMLVHGRGRRGAPRSQQQGKVRRIAYTLILAVIFLLLFVQFFMLLLSLLPNSFAFHSIVDRLFDFYIDEEVPEERRPALLDPLENAFACKFRVEHEVLEQLGLQEPCRPKIKDRLLAPYIVIFLLFVVAAPFLYLIFLVLWSKRLKECTPILGARQKLEANIEARRKKGDTQKWRKEEEKEEVKKAGEMATVGEG